MVASNNEMRLAARWKNGPVRCSMKLCSMRVESNSFSTEVKHIVTVGEPLGCALANRCLVAKEEIQIHFWRETFPHVPKG